MRGDFDRLALRKHYSFRLHPAVLEFLDRLAELAHTKRSQALQFVLYKALSADGGPLPPGAFSPAGSYNTPKLTRIEKAFRKLCKEERKHNGNSS